MDMKPLKITAVLSVMALLLVSGSAYAAMFVSGEAELDYINYQAKVGGKDVFKGNTLAQKYNLSYTLSNFAHRDQPEYYDLRLGYEWLDFDTKVTELDRDTKISQTSGRYLYSGKLGYNPYHLPIKFSAFINSDTPVTYATGLNQQSLIGDSLLYAISDTAKSVSSGATFIFEPDKSRSSSLYGLPRLYLDYFETDYKNSNVTARTDSKIRELALAGLNKENNWLVYRSTIYENRLNSAEGYSRQSIQLGHVNNTGQRLWASLTNWIDVSVDGKLTNYVSKTPGDSFEEYDLNFMAIAKRQSWEARTFTNYNRNFGQNDIRETVRVPFYLKGLYGADSDWYVSVATQQMRDKFWTGKTTDSSYANTVTVGGSTFHRSKFILAPSLMIQTSKDFGGNDSYSVEANLETNSTARFSNRVGLGGKVFWKNKDDGSGGDLARSWSTGMEISANYRPDTKFYYKAVSLAEVGRGNGYIESVLPAAGVVQQQNTSPPDFIRESLSASVSWTPTADFSTSLEGSFDSAHVTNRSSLTATSVNYRMSYYKMNSFFRLDSKYESINDGRKREAIRNQFDVQYLPNINNEASIKFVQQYDRIYAYNSSNTYEVLQKYSYKLFTRDGVVRNFATLSQEYSYKSAGLTGLNAAGVTTQYLSLTGRYSPTSKLTLYGSVKYEKADPGLRTLFYGTGLNADFKLLATSLDYSYAKRENDNRVEKKLAATVRRSF